MTAVAAASDTPDDTSDDRSAGSRAAWLVAGSFYHHFSGMAEYLGELASFFGVEQPQLVVERLSVLDPQERLRRLEHLSVELHMGALHRAMRDWAIVNEPAAEAVRVVGKAVGKAAGVALP